MRLGELIRQLKACDPEKPIRYSFWRFVPTRPRSYRGSYDQLALGWEKPDDGGKEYGEKWPKVRELLAWCEHALGKTYEGYKGGWYPMTERTMVWMANWGECHDTGIVAVRDAGIEVVIDTGYAEPQMEPEMMADMVGRLHGRPGKYDQPPEDFER